MWYGTSWINHIPSFDIQISAPQLINAHLPIRTCTHFRQPHATEVWKWDDNAEFQLKSADSKNKLHVQGCSKSTQNCTRTCMRSFSQNSPTLQISRFCRNCEIRLHDRSAAMYTNIQYWLVRLTSSTKEYGPVFISIRNLSRILPSLSETHPARRERRWKEGSFVSRV